MSEIWAATTGREDAPHIVLVHGTLDRSAGLLKLSRRLDDRFLVTRYDRRGYGRSRPHDGPFGIVQQVDDLSDVVTNSDRDHSARRPRIIIGHSYGGNVALAFAQRYPGLVDAIVTYETPLSWLPWWDGNSTRADEGDWAADPPQAAEDFMRAMISDAKWERLPNATREDRRAEGHAMVGELLDLRRAAAWSGDAIKVPVLALHGELGREPHARGARVIAASVPDGRFGSIAGAKHPGPNTHPDATAAAIVEFVRPLLELG